jgi:Tol biopolymer transport system component
MVEKKARFVFGLAVLPGSLAGMGERSSTNEREHNRCREHRFGQFSEWSAPVNLGPVVNSPFNDQHPAISPDGLSLYVTSDRPDGFGNLDIYVSQRASVDDDWNLPQNLGPIINTEFQDGVPTFSADGRRMYFCSDRPGTFGSYDIWVSSRDDPTDDFGWQTPTNAGSGVNTEKTECGPTIFEDRHNGVTTLYFSRSVGPTCGFGDPNEKC